MLIRSLDLSFAYCLDRRIMRRTHGAFCVFADFVQTALVERVFAKEVYGGKVEVAAAGGTAAGLENCGFRREVGHFFALGFGFGGVAGC